MPFDREHRLAVFAEAAAAAVQRKQTPTAVRLLAITMAEAVEAGCSEAADVARERLLELSPRHMLGRAETAADAVRDDEISQFLSTVRREYPYEEAELWVASRPADDRRPLDPSRPVCQQVTEWLVTAGRPGE